MTPTEAHSDAVQRLNPPRQRQVAVMFADLDHFTRICAEDPPHRVFRLVRDFHHVVTESVARCKGRLNAYLGDGAMATFGDGQGRIDCATRALRCALTILEQIVHSIRSSLTPVVGRSRSPSVCSMAKPWLAP
jgi:class 3 adenylate cyclase